VIGAARRFIGSLVALIRIQPFETESVEGRSKERYRRVLLTAGTAVGTRALAVVTTLISVPLTLHYLGAESYGLWMTIGSVLALMSFADLGIGNGLLNALADAYGKEDRMLARQAVASAFFMLSAIAAIVLGVFAVVYRFVPWADVFNVKSSAAINAAGPVMVVFVACFAVNVPLGIVQRVLMGYQRGYVANLWQGLGSLFSLAGVIAAVEARASLPWLVLAMTGGPIVATFLNGIAEFGWSRPWLRPAWREASGLVARRILRLGVLFFFLQLATTAVFASDNIVISQVRGAGAVTFYSVPQRIFVVYVLMVAMLMGPLWPAYGEAVSRGDFGWVRRTVRRSLWATFALTAVPGAVFVVFGRAILHLWVGDAVKPSAWLLLGFGVWAVASMLWATVTLFLNGVNMLKFELACLVPLALVGLGMKIAGAFSLGLTGVVWAGNIAYMLFALIPAAIYVPKLLDQLPARFPQTWAHGETPLQADIGGSIGPL
jgi:O-antigen/teichoic acid export membrane protein